MHDHPLASTALAVLAGLAIGYVCALAATSILLSVAADVHPIIEFVAGYLVWVSVGIAVMYIVRRALRRAPEAGAETILPIPRPASDAATGDGGGPLDNRDSDDEEHA
jgi:hypothetical protein